MFSQHTVLFFTISGPIPCTLLLPPPGSPMLTYRAGAGGAAARPHTSRRHTVRFGSSSVLYVRVARVLLRAQL